jgi:hypothetical protein
MADAGAAANVYRHRGGLGFVFGRAGGAEAAPPDLAAEAIGYVSRDEGLSWTETPFADGISRQTQIVPGNGSLLRYDFDGVQTWVRASEDGAEWQPPLPAYKAPFRLYGVVFDPASGLYWCAAHGEPGIEPGERETHLVNSRDGIGWDYVSTVFTSGVPDVGEAVVHFEPDGTAVVVAGANTLTSHYQAVAAAPYTSWQLSELPDMVVGHSWFSLGGRTFLATRANHVPDSDGPIAGSQPDGPRPYIAIHRLMKGGEWRLWAVVDSQGECSHPRLVETPTEVLCAYTSQHEDGVAKPFLAGFDRIEFLRRR